MIRRFLVLSVLLFGAAGFASAESFSFSFNSASGPTETVSGTLLTTETSTPGEYTITGITDGLFDGTTAITLLDAGLFEGSDNLLFDPADPGYVDYYGFSFVADGQDYNLYFSPDGYQLATEVDSNYTFTAGSFTLGPVTTSATPEPGSLLLLGTGLLGVCGVLRRKLAV